MPSPFPGMNPYLEQEDVWHDFHERFIPRLAEALTPQVQPRYIVKLDQHAYIHELPAEDRRLIGRPDVYLAASGGASSQPAAGGELLEGPVQGLLPVAVDTERQGYVQVRDRHSRELVTVVELLSPANKTPGPDREQYLAKRREFLAGGVNVVEIDLLRGGARPPVQGLPGGVAYYALVSRSHKRPRADLWPLTLRDPLPELPVPLRSGEPEARISLQNLLHQVYDAAGYEAYIYEGAPTPALGADDAAWAFKLLRAPD